MSDHAGKPFQPELYRTYLRILAYATLRDLGALRGKIDASDIVQEALIQSFIALPEFRGSTEQEFTTWLKRILQNKLLDAIRHFKRKKRDQELERTICDSLDETSVRFAQIVAADETSPSQHVIKHERIRLIATAFGALPDSQRTALELHHIQGHSLKETAKLMSRTTAGVAGLLRRGLQAMREGLEDKRDLR